MGIELLQIYLAGVLILLGAIILNVLAQKVGLLTWYEFLRHPKKVRFTSGIFLFVIYPLLLGILGYLGLKLFS